MTDDHPSQPPLVLAFVADLMFATRIESAAAAQGFFVRWIETAGQVPANRSSNDWFPVEQPPITSTTPDHPSDERFPGDHQPVDRQPPVNKPLIDRQPAEHMFGPGADLIELVSAARPALMIFDLGNRSIPWREWIALLKSAPATRRYPVLAYGAHVEAEILAEARRRGADAVLPRSRFAADLPNLIRKYARLPDQAAIQTACQAELSDLARRGIDLFNHGEYFEAHEVLEEAWNQDSTPGRELYRAILQVAVAYLQIERGNYNGAVKMFLRMRQWIDPLPDVCRGVDVARLRGDAGQVRLHLLELGRDGIATFDRSLFQKVYYRN